MKSIICLFLILFTSLISAPARALEPFALYDNFNSKFIDAERWFASESVTGNVQVLENIRGIEGQRLRILSRSYRPGGGPVRTERSENQLRFPAPVGITALKASVKINAVEAIGCPDTTSAPTRARARLVGSFFNTEGPPYNGQVNDIIADILIQRQSDSVDRAQVLNVYAEVFRCSEASCYTTNFYKAEPLGDIMLGQWADIMIVWDPLQEKFIFQLNKNQVSIGYPFGLPPFYPPNNRFKNIGVSNRFPYCSTLGREAFLDADFENIFINKSAIP